jgi:UDPglucose 6-dehydrogenase
LGKLGASIAAAMASRGLSVTGVDIDAEKVALVNAGRAPVQEPGLEELVQANRSRFSATLDLDGAVGATETTFIVVPTPSDACGAFSLAAVEDAVLGIARALRRKSGSHLVVVTSTVMPGDSESRLIPLLELESGRRLGSGLGYCYSPEFVALGSVIRDFLQPDFVLIGAGDTASGEQLAALYTGLLADQTPVVQLSCANAELAKLAVNSYVTMKISFANTLAQLCEGLPAGDVDAVTTAIGLDSRIGSGYLKGALGFGGPCFPRDNAAFAGLASRLGAEPFLAQSTDDLNRRQRERILDRLIAEVPLGKAVAVLGLAYKPGTDVVTESQGLWLAEKLAAAGYDVVVYDPLAMDAARAVLGNAVTFASSLEKALMADAVLVTNPDPAFSVIAGSSFSDRHRPALVLDCWRLLRASLATDPRVRYLATGLPATETQEGERK